MLTIDSHEPVPASSGTAVRAWMASPKWDEMGNLALRFKKKKKKKFRFLKKLNMDFYHMTQQFHSEIHAQQHWKQVLDPDTRSLMFTAALAIIAQKQKQPECPATDEWLSKMWCGHAKEHYSAMRKKFGGALKRQKKKKKKKKVIWASFGV